MSLNLNRVTLAGNLTRDPEVRQVGADRAVANFGLAVNRRWRNQQSGEMTEEVTFIDIEAWGRTAELAGQYLRKGSPAYLEGRLKFDTWEDKEGQKRSKLRVVADTIQFLASRPAGDPEGNAAEGVESTTAANGAPPAAAPTRRPARLPAKAASAAVGEDPPF